MNLEDVEAKFTSSHGPKYGGCFPINKYLSISGEEVTDLRYALLSAAPHLLRIERRPSSSKSENQYDDDVNKNGGWYIVALHAGATEEELRQMCRQYNDNLAVADEIDEVSSPVGSLARELACGPRPVASLDASPRSLIDRPEFEIFVDDGIEYARISPQTIDSVRQRRKGRLSQWTPCSDKEGRSASGFCFSPVGKLNFDNRRPNEGSALTSITEKQEDAQGLNRDDDTTVEEEDDEITLPDMEADPQLNAASLEHGSEDNEHEPPLELPPLLTEDDEHHDITMTDEDGASQDANEGGNPANEGANPSGETLDRGAFSSACGAQEGEENRKKASPSSRHRSPSSGRESSVGGTKTLSGLASPVASPVESPSGNAGKASTASIRSRDEKMARERGAICKMLLKGLAAIVRERPIKLELLHMAFDAKYRAISWDPLQKLGYTTMEQFVVDDPVANRVLKVDGTGLVSLVIRPGSPSTPGRTPTSTGARGQAQALAQAARDNTPAARASASSRPNSPTGNSTNNTDQSSNQTGVLVESMNTKSAHTGVLVECSSQPHAIGTSSSMSTTSRAPLSSTSSMGNTTNTNATAANNNSNSNLQQYAYPFPYCSSALDDEAVSQGLTPNGLSFNTKHSGRGDGVDVFSGDAWPDARSSQQTDETMEYHPNAENVPIDNAMHKEALAAHTRDVNYAVKSLASYLFGPKRENEVVIAGCTGPMDRSKKRAPSPTASRSPAMSRSSGLASPGVQPPDWMAGMESAGSPRKQEGTHTDTVEKGGEPTTAPQQQQQQPKEVSAMDLLTRDRARNRLRERVAALNVTSSSSNNNNPLSNKTPGGGGGGGAATPPSRPSPPPPPFSLPAPVAQILIASSDASVVEGDQPMGQSESMNVNNNERDSGMAMMMNNRSSRSVSRASSPRSDGEKNFGEKKDGETPEVDEGQLPKEDQKLLLQNVKVARSMAQGKMLSSHKTGPKGPSLKGQKEEQKALLQQKLRQKLQTLKRQKAEEAERKQQETQALEPKRQKSEPQQRDSDLRPLERREDTAKKEIEEDVIMVTTPPGKKSDKDKKRQRTGSEESDCVVLTVDESRDRDKRQKKVPVEEKVEDLSAGNKENDKEKSSQGKNGPAGAIRQESRDQDFRPSDRARSRSNQPPPAAPSADAPTPSNNTSSSGGGGGGISLTPNMLAQRALSSSLSRDSTASPVRTGNVTLQRRSRTPEERMNGPASATQEARSAETVRSSRPLSAGHGGQNQEGSAVRLEPNRLRADDDVQLALFAKSITEVFEWFKRPLRLKELRALWEDAHPGCFLNHLRYGKSSVLALITSVPHITFIPDAESSSSGSQAKSSSKAGSNGIFVYKDYKDDTRAAGLEGDSKSPFGLDNARNSHADTSNTGNSSGSGASACGGMGDTSPGGGKKRGFKSNIPLDPEDVLALGGNTSILARIHNFAIDVTRKAFTGGKGDQDYQNYPSLQWHVEKHPEQPWIRYACSSPSQVFPKCWGSWCSGSLKANSEGCGPVSEHLAAKMTCALKLAKWFGRQRNLRAESDFTQVEKNRLAELRELEHKDDSKTSKTSKTASANSADDSNTVEVFDDLSFCRLLSALHGETQAIGIAVGKRSLAVCTGAGTFVVRLLILDPAYRPAFCYQLASSVTGSRRKSPPSAPQEASQDQGVTKSPRPENSRRGPLQAGGKMDGLEELLGDAWADVAELPLVSNEEEADGSKKTRIEYPYKSLFRTIDTLAKGSLATQAREAWYILSQSSATRPCSEPRQNV